MTTEKIIFELKERLQQCEPEPDYYMFNHSYRAAKDAYDNCMRVVNSALYNYCTDGGHCEWFCDGKCFEPKENDDDKI